MRTLKIVLSLTKKGKRQRSNCHKLILSIKFEMPDEINLTDLTLFYSLH